MKTDKKRPLGIFGDTSRSPMILDLIFSFLVKEIKRKDLPCELQGKSVDELQVEYNKHFPVIVEYPLPEEDICFNETPMSVAYFK